MSLVPLEWWLVSEGEEDPSHLARLFAPGLDLIPGILCPEDPVHP